MRDEHSLVVADGIDEVSVDTASDIDSLSSIPMTPLLTPRETDNLLDAFGVGMSASSGTLKQSETQRETDDLLDAFVVGKSATSSALKQSKLAQRRTKRQRRRIGSIQGQQAIVEPRHDLDSRPKILVSPRTSLHSSIGVDQKGKKRTQVPRMSRQRVGSAARSSTIAAVTFGKNQD